MKDRAREVVDQTGTLERAWKSVTTSAREAWDAMLAIGREKTLQQKIADQKKVIEDIRDGLTPGRIDMAQDYLAQLEAQAGAQQKAAQAGADGAKNMRDYLDVESKVAPIQKKGAEQTRSLAEALKEYRDNLARVKALDPNSALLDPAKVAAGEAAIREQYKPRSTRSGRKDHPDDARVLFFVLMHVIAAATCFVLFGAGWYRHAHLWLYGFMYMMTVGLLLWYLDVLLTRYIHNSFAAYQDTIKRIAALVVKQVLIITTSTTLIIVGIMQLPVADILSQQYPGMAQHCDRIGHNPYRHDHLGGRLYLSAVETKSYRK